MDKKAEEKPAREIPDAARIEAGRKIVFAALCESPLTFQAIIIWLEEIEAGKVRLGEVVDLEATYASWKNRPSSKNGSGAGVGFNGGSSENSEASSASEDEVLSGLERLREIYKELRRLQDSKIELERRTDEAQERSSEGLKRQHEALRRELVAGFSALSWNEHRIQALVEQLLEIGQQFDEVENRLLRRAMDRGVGRDDFIDKFRGSEIEPKWTSRVETLEAAGWKEFVAKEKAAIKAAQEAMWVIARTAGRPIRDLRKVVEGVENGWRMMTLAHAPGEGDEGR